MNKEALLSFSLWAQYYNFLSSLREIFSKELATQLNETIVSYIESAFYDQNGGIKEDRSVDYPEYEVIYFEVAGKKNSIDLSFSYGDTSSLSINFWQVDEKSIEEDSNVLYEYVCSLDSVFLPDVINTIICWIKTGELDDFGKSVAESI